MVPLFTGRKTECEEITGHLTSGSARIVSIWGSPGIGKTSVAITVGHHLHSLGLPVYYLSLRGLQSKVDLASKLLSLLKLPIASEQQRQQYSSIDDEISYLFSEFSEPFTIILDNADELLTGGQEVKEDITNFLADILRQSEKLTLVITTREYLKFMNVQFQSHKGVRISPLDEHSSQSLVHLLLPDVSVTDCKRVSEICGHVPLAIKILCVLISEDYQVSQVVESLQNHTIVEMLDNPDFPSNVRLQLLLNSSFQRLSAQEKEALMSLSVFPESFDPRVAAAVLGISEINVTRSVLHNLQRKSLLQLSSMPDTFLMHPLIKQFARQKHASTADSYHSLGDTQHAQGDFSSALQSAQRALDIRLKLFGEEHASTADSYHSLGDTQHAQGDFSSALQSAQRALDIRLKLFGEEHASTADSYHSLGDTQHAQGDFSSALQSAQRALDIRLKLFGEEHVSTADSYHSLGDTQHAQGDFSSALQSAQRALDIRLKLFGEEHASTADSYHSLRNTQHAQGDFSSALQSAQRALDIRLKLFGEHYSSTAGRYHSLRETRHTRGKFTPAGQTLEHGVSLWIVFLGTVTTRMRLYSQAKRCVA